MGAYRFTNTSYLLIFVQRHCSCIAIFRTIPTISFYEIDLKSFGHTYHNTNKHTNDNSPQIHIQSNNQIPMNMEIRGVGDEELKCIALVHYCFQLMLTSLLYVILFCSINGSLDLLSNWFKWSFCAPNGSRSRAVLTL